MELDFRKPIEVNAVLIQEYIPLGQRVKSFSIEAYVDDSYTEVATGITVGNRRILKFKTVKTQKLKINLEAKACPLISNIEVYRVPEMIGDPITRRNKKGKVRIYSESPDPVFYYATDSSEPSTRSALYTGPFDFSKPGIILV